MLAYTPAVTEQPLSGQEPEEILPAPAPVSRRAWLAIGTAAGVAIVAGGVAIGLASSSASASPATVAAAASSATSSAHPSRPTGTDAPRGPIGPFLAGKVKSVSGTKILITDAQGFTRTIITSAKTTYKDGLSASPAVGTEIFAIGTVDADGTSLDAATVSATPKLPAGGFGRGPGGPSGRGFGGSGTPGAKPTGARPTGARPTDHPSGFPHGPGGPGGYGGPHGSSTPTATKTS